MSITKILSLLFAICLSAFSSAVPAAVYEFANSRSTTDANSNFTDDDFAKSMNFDFSAAYFSQSGSGFTSDSLNGMTAVYSANESGVSGLPYMDSRNQFRRGIHNKLADDDWNKRSDKYTTITSPVPEPDTYVMILAGLALIGFTARHRNQNS